MPGRFRRPDLIDANLSDANLFPSPLGVLGLTTAGKGRGATASSRVSVPSRGFGSDDALWSCRGACISLVSVPSRGFGSDDH
ncbi:Uncharacterised protein [Mycobacterium tuberculosis]|nr:Uncharacterised protein [Mycobacterium tuberculosis]CKY84509.1 Uncharacterised protein [Mycobacterium tuberculosis]CLZ10603.1 Uncharacterised protein [Mycobacterium tuberculosis]SGD76853.1 Uncharacterised protein [Mycobacterium tuberculosis]SGF49264.1 Uncharacterised protein [Mycobacterium tuberculosis]